ncbi:hypothetical protein Taro_005006 [Colocasia esculenta]|uniref:Uncharacterized protein n=1 Tax=Colocasia esculenta TaxID=4460 RepID=A0A843TLV4_COLES|nr:hypothetical protein [Colocasia esculenta]
MGSDRENRVIGVSRGSGSWVVTVGIRARDMAPRRHSPARQLIEQQDESEMPAQGQVQEEVSADESVAQPQGAAAATVVGSVPARVGSSRCSVLGTSSSGAGAVGRAEVEQPEHQQRSGTGSTRAGRRRTTVTEDRTALLERFLRLRPLMFHGEYDPDKAESWTHKLEPIFETMECAEEDQRFSEVFHSEYFPDYTRRERRDQFHALVQDDLTVLQYHKSGRVIALTWEQAEASNLVIGTLPILGRAARVLVDPGASLCFASEEFYESLACHAPERQCDVMVDLSFGVVLVACGARRRRPFLREGPNGCVLRVEECENSMLELSEVSFERRSMLLRDRFLEGLLWNPTQLETRQPQRPRPCRDGAPGRDVVVTLLSIALGSRHARASRHGRNGPPCETSKQRQGARWAKEMGQ